MNPAQQRAVRATFDHVNDLLEDVERLAQADLNPFDRERSDLSPVEVRELGRLVTALRARMLEALQRLGIPGPQPDGSARWSAQTAFLYADIALSELEGRSLRAYGALSDQDAERVTAVARELRALVARGQGLLRDAEGPGESEDES